MKSKEIFVIDAHAYLYRNYYALPKLTSPSGEEVGALYGFTRFLLKILREKNPNFIVACYDSPVRGFRYKIFPEYKANRAKTDEALIKQIELSKNVVSALGVPLLTIDGYEADDVISSVANSAKKEGYKVVIVSGDKDLMQLIGEDVFLWDGTSSNYYGREYVEEKFGVPPEKIPEYLALVGDNSDNVPGIKGIGPKSAVKLIQKYGNIENIIKAISLDVVDKELMRIKENINDLKLSRELVKLENNLKIDIEKLKKTAPDKELLKSLAQRFMFKEFLNMLESQEKNVKKEIFKEDIKDFLNSKKNYISFEPNKNILVYEDKYSEYENTQLSEILKFNGAKYFYDLKTFLHERKIYFSVENFEDIYIAYHLCYGGERKPDLKRIIMENVGIIEDSNNVLYSFYFKKVIETLLSQLEEKNVIKLYRDIELPLIDILLRMENYGIKIDVEKLKLLDKEFDKKINDLKSKFVKLTGYDINLNSPKQVSDFIYNKLTLPIDEKQKKSFKTKTGYSTSEETLRFMSGMHPSIDLILTYRELAKLKTSFVQPLIEKVSEDGRIRTIFDQTGTQTGRLSSSSPNLQNIPVKSEMGQKIRECFIAEDGWLLLSADYSQIDLRVLAHLSQDEVLVNAFINNVDIHIKTACEIFSLPPEKIDEKKRKIAKTINFGIIYGQTPMGLSRELGIDYHQAEAYIKNYFEVYKGVKIWTENIIKQAREKGYVQNFVGRRRNIPDINSQNKNLRLFSERVAVNMPVQSGSSDIIKKAMIDIDKEIRDKDDIKMLLQIHDELLFEVKKDKVDYYKNLIKEKMEKAFVLKVPLKVDLKVGRNWAELKKIL